MTNDLPPQPASTRPRVTPAVLITAVVAVVVGILLGAAGGYVVANNLAVEDDEGSRGEQDVATGCAVLERVRDELPLDQESARIDHPVAFELIGVGHLFMAAEQADDEHAAIGALGRDLMAGMTRLDVDMVNSSADKLLTECADR